MNPINLTEEQFDFIYDKNLNVDEFNQIIQEMITSNKNNSQNNNLKQQLGSSQGAFAIIFIQFKYYLVEIKQVSLYLMTKEMVNENSQKLEFLNKLNIKHYFFMKLHWFQFLENNAAYLLVFNTQFLQRQLKLKYLLQISQIYSETLQICSNKKQQRSNKINNKQQNVIYSQGKFITEPIQQKKIKTSNYYELNENEQFIQIM